MRTKASSARVKPTPAAVSRRASEPVSVAIELQPEGTPGRRAQATQADLVIDEIKVVVQALAAVGFEEGLPARLVAPGSVAVARLHRRDDRRQSRMIAAPLKHLGHDLFLADVRPGDVLNGNPRRRRQLLSASPDRIAQRLGKTCVVEYPNPSRLQKRRHTLRVHTCGSVPVATIRS